MSEMVNHPGHDHRLLADEKIYLWEDCSLCGHRISKGVSNYYCNICDKWWHKTCIRAPSELVEFLMQIHQHHLLPDEELHNFEECSECSGSLYYGLSNYHCKICNKWWHKRCIPSSSELVNHPYHPNHVLKLLVGGPPDYADDRCHFCRQELKNYLYHCSTCNYSLDLRCGYSPNPVTIDEPKSHNHPLTLMARQVSFACSACGTYGERNPYVCVACSFMVHKECVDLPHVININRHNHRISHTYSLGPGKRICRICRKNLSWVYGAYTCSKCPDFFVHSKCATNSEVWDGHEMEGTPEEEEEEPMFKMIEEGVINHVKHPSHNLRLTDDGVLRGESFRCQLCERLVYSDTFYSCMECDYILHETCAYLTKKKRVGFSSYPLSLVEFVKEKSRDGTFKCSVCTQVSTGHSYADHRGDNPVDLRCATVDWSCDHECHPHTLFLTNLEKDTCEACSSEKIVLRCVDCEFNLCYKCASYPKKIMHRCDDHPLVLSFGDKWQYGTSWCTVCEAKIDLTTWFYECEDCGIVCHIHCVLGDFTGSNPGLYTIERTDVLPGLVRKVVCNNGSKRPHCLAFADASHVWQADW